MGPPRLRLEVIDDAGKLIEAVEVGEITGVHALVDPPLPATALAGPADPGGGCPRGLPPLRR